jgi:hypothetical protein
MARAAPKSGNVDSGESVVIMGVVVRELEKEGVGLIQSTRIGKNIVSALEALRARRS